jgi:hypothetical protein
MESGGKATMNRGGTFGVGIPGRVFMTVRRLYLQ